MGADCPFCEQFLLIPGNKEPLFIYEFEHSYLLFGQHQFYPGYCLLVSKNHARELHHLSSDIRNGLWQELMQSGSAIDKIFNPWKLNYACYGNQVEHIHWHIFPRYLNDPNYRDCPFTNSAQFSDFPTDMNILKEQRENLRKLFGG